MHRPDRFAQLRYFIPTPEFRGKGLGKSDGQVYAFLKEANYQGAYL
jgi:hypothetical protein